MTAAKPAAGDHAIREAVEDELTWAPEVNSAGVGVSVVGGVVTLSGELEGNAQRIAAVHAAGRVRGVNTVVDNLVVHPSKSRKVTDEDIATAVHDALLWNSSIPVTVKADVRNHVVVLTGEVQWNFERASAKHAVESVKGVTFVDSRITLARRPSAPDAEERILKALVRNAAVDASRVSVLVQGTLVTLTGVVSSWAEKEQAELAAWSSPHVTDVDNQLVVSAL